MFINDQCNCYHSPASFSACLEAMDRFFTQVWAPELALDFVRAFNGH